jgi:hypothetical protein
MAEYLVELYVAHGDHVVARQHVTQAERAGAELSREGRTVRYVRSILVPEDETCFLLYEADSTDLVAEAVHRAGLRLGGRLHEREQHDHHNHRSDRAAQQAAEGLEQR